MAHRDATEHKPRRARNRAAPPQPEVHEPRVDDPGLTDLSRQDYVAIAKRSFREAMDDGITDLAAALAYYTFLALPSVLLLSLGLFTLVAGEDALDTVLDKVGTVAPQETVDLLRDSLTRAMDNQSASIAMIAVGGVIALWAVTGAMTAFMRATNQAYEREERTWLRTPARCGAGDVRPHLRRLRAVLRLADPRPAPLGLDRRPDRPREPRLLGLVGRTVADPDPRPARRLRDGPLPGPERGASALAADHLGALVAVVVWLVASGLFAVYVSMFGSYNKAWGSLAAVIVMLTWLWLSALAVLLGAEINAETQRSRELRQGRSRPSAICRRRRPDAGRRPRLVRADASDVLNGARRGSHGTHPPRRSHGYGRPYYGPIG